MSLLASPHLLDSPRWKGLRVGLLGGTFNPPHEGHVHISLSALKGLKLDSVWWLVTPQNPLKEASSLSMAERVKLCHDLVNHPQILVSDIEKDLKVPSTYYVVNHLRHHYPHTDFVWITGMDNALNLHRWNRWKDLLGQICMVHLTRQPAASLIQASPLRMATFQKHKFISRAGRYPLDSGTTYWMMQKKMINISSTQIRNKNH